VHYRCAEQPVPVPDYIDWVLLEEQVPCGETIQYVIYDLNDCADPALTQFSAAWCVSMDCAEAVVEQAEDAATDQQ